MEFSKFYRSVDELADALENAKLTWTGAFSKVYYLEDLDLCVKETQDAAYMKFVKTVIENPNKHFPKIYGVFEIEDVYYVFMERLYLSEFSTNIESTLPKFNSNWGTHIWYGKVSKEFDEVLDLLDCIEVNYERIVMDLRASNIMQRCDGTIVITDPFYDKESV